MDLLRKWSEEYGYGAPVVSLAYDLSTLSIGKLSFAYIDKIIEDWHESGAKTLEECEARYMEFRRIRSEAEEKKRETLAEKTRVGRPKKEKPRYGDFDPEAALEMALSRSFFDDEEKDK
jgi:DnaD/phage-associated family protein